MAKDVKCINAKNYSLTVNREYEAEEIPNNNNYYYVTNNNGVRARYASNLFEDIVEEVILDTLQQIKDKVRVNTEVINYNGRKTKTKVEFDIDEVDVNLEINFSLSQASNSCGIYNAEGLEDLMTKVQENVPNRGNLRKFVLEEIMANIKHNNTNTGMVTYTTNNNHNLFDDLEVVMDNLSAAKSIGVNPVHNTTIMMWTFTYGN